MIVHIFWVLHTSLFVRFVYELIRGVRGFVGLSRCRVDVGGGGMGVSLAGSSTAIFYMRLKNFVKSYQFFSLN